MPIYSGNSSGRSFNNFQVNLALITHSSPAKCKIKLSSPQSMISYNYYLSCQVPNRTKCPGRRIVYCILHSRQNYYPYILTKKSKIVQSWKPLNHNCSISINILGLTFQFCHCLLMRSI